MSKHLISISLSNLGTLPQNTILKVSRAQISSIESSLGIEFKKPSIVKEMEKPQEIAEQVANSIKSLVKEEGLVESVKIEKEEIFDSQEAKEVEDFLESDDDDEKEFQKELDARRKQIQTSIEADRAEKELTTEEKFCQVERGQKDFPEPKLTYSENFGE